MVLRKLSPRKSIRCFSLAASVCACLLVGCDQALQTPVTVEVKTPSDDELKRQLDEALDFTFKNRHLNLKDHAAWQILHGVLAYQRDFQIRNDGRLVSAINYLLQDGYMKGWTVEPGDAFGSSGQTGLRAILEPGSKTGQGHADQWLAVLAQCALPPEETIQAGNRSYTMADFVRQVEWDVPRNFEREYSWTLIGLTSYRPTTYEWTASDSQKWSIEKLMEIELEQELLQSACGGTHRLIGMSMALNHHLANQEKLTGVWKQAEEKIRQAIQAAREFRNKQDGSLSANYFSRPGLTPDAAEDLGTTGHTLEFLTLAMTNEELTEPWVKQAVSHLCRLFRRTKDVPLECGALYHAAHGLVLYRQRVFGPWLPPKEPEEKNSQKTALN